MDLGLGLDDDDIFDNCHGRTKEPCKDPYSVRLCPELWFNSIDVSGLSTVDAQTVTKYRGDVAYHEEQYENALLTFQRCQDLLQPNNVAMRRGVEEDSARCHLRLGQLDSALDRASNVVSLAQNFEQVTDTLFLLLDIYTAAGKTKEMLCTLKKLLLLHPNNSGLWTQLGDLYSPKPSCIAQDGGPRRTYDALIDIITDKVKPCCCSGESNSLKLQVDREKSTVECHEKLTADNNSQPEIACGCSERVSVGKNERIVAVIDAGDFSDPVSDRFESISCADDLECRNETSLRRDRLVICLTCFLSARLLLRSVHCRLNSFAKTKNERDQLKVESRLDLLLAELDVGEEVERCSEFLKVALNLTEADEGIASTNKICDMTPRQILCEDARCTAVFDQKWFSWMKKDASRDDGQFEFKTV